MGTRVLFDANLKKGFTLVELVVVIVMLSIIAVVAIPRFTGKETFDTLGFYNQTKAAIRYAHKTAIAQRRTVHVNLTANAICLTYVADANCTNVAGGDIVLSPASGLRFYTEAPSGVSFNTIGSFSFSPLGRPSAGQSIGVVGDSMTRTIVVESETGYVH